ncbi:MAG TPA: thioredoxin [Acidimicrobiia bacterium]
MSASTAMTLPDGYAIFVSRDCETCREIEPALRQLVDAGIPLTFVSQDDPGYPEGVAGVIDDRDLELSWRLDIEVTPTAVRITDGNPGGRVAGWRKSEWEEFFGVSPLGPGLPEHRPGCGSATLLPGAPEKLAARFGGGPALVSRRIAIDQSADEYEEIYARGWTDGLPVITPTEERVIRMLGGTRRDPAEIIGVLPPDYAECTVEKAAINAVMAGCLPEYLPVVLAAVESFAAEPFNGHGVVATTWYSGPVIIVNGPIGARIGMNAEHNVFGPGNRANATIGRALNLIVRNIGGARPGAVDRSTQGHPSKYTMAFPEREADSPWSSLAVERGVPEGASAVTLFAGQGPAPIADQKSTSPESLVRSLAAGLRTVRHPKAVRRVAALLAIAPEHARIFGRAGWDKDRLRDEIIDLLTFPDSEIVVGADGIDEGSTGRVSGELVAKFTPDNLWFVHVGGGAGGSSGIISGWVTGPKGSAMVTTILEEG